jgi:hypothetical protein
MPKRYSKVVLTLFIASLLSMTSEAALTGAPAHSGNQATAQNPGDKEAQLAELRKKIAGQENKLSEEVFKNIQIFKGVPAGRLLRVMEMGYSKSLGVDCAHCHVPGQWEKEDKAEKQIARDMAGMVQTINTSLLKSIKNLKSQNPVVNCTTCHRGQTKPALNL